MFCLSQFLALPFKRKSEPCQRIEPREDEEGARERGAVFGRVEPNGRSERMGSGASNSQKSIGRLCEKPKIPLA